MTLTPTQKALVDRCIKALRAKTDNETTPLNVAGAAMAAEGVYSVACINAAIKQMGEK